jgi:predicted RNA binding protein YcfA (HicA-like mRNA interferase family)
MKKHKILEKVLAGSKNVRFDEFVTLLEDFGFELKRTRGSHHVFTHPKIPRPFPIQPKGKQAKPYQVRQLLALVEQYNLELKNEGEDEA